MSYDRLTLGNDVVELLRRNPRLTLIELARRTGVERHTVESACREVTGLIFRALKREYQYRRACELLRQRPYLSIKQVASGLGYSNSQSFSRFIQRTVGQSPTTLRRKLLKGDLTPDAS